MSLRPPRVHLAQKQVLLQRPGICSHARNPEHGFQQLAGRVQMVGSFAPVVGHVGIILLAENLPPGIEIPRNVGIAVGLPTDTSYQKHEAGVRAKHAGCGVRGGVLSAKRFVVAAQLANFGEMRLLKRVDAGQGVEVSGQPAVVLSEQARDELRRNVRGRAYEISPALLRSRSSRHEHAPGSNADVCPVKIQNRSQGNYLL